MDKLLPVLGLPAEVEGGRHTRMRAYLDSQRDWLRTERLPAYAPELNPVEYLRANLKDLELANLPTNHPGRGRRRH
jgi:transposase